MPKPKVLINGKLHSYPEDAETIDRYFAELPEPEHYVPENPVMPDPRYRLEADIRNVQDAFVREGMSRHDADIAAKIVWDNMLPAMYQNIDEWVLGQKLSDVMYGKDKITLPYLEWTWEHENNCQMGMDYFVSRLRRYIETGESAGLYPGHL